MKDIKEGVPTIPPHLNQREFEQASKAFFGNLYDFNADNHKKNQLLVVMALALAGMALTFFFYVKNHHNVQLLVIDSSQAGDVPFRVLEFDNSVKGKEGLYSYFFSMITQNLFTYNKDTLIENRKLVAEYLDRSCLKGLEVDTQNLIQSYTRLGRFEKGNPKATVKNVIFLERRTTGLVDILKKTSQEMEIQIVQVYADIELFDEGGRVMEASKTYLITYKFNNEIPKTREEIQQLNPLGIKILEWNIQEAGNITKLAS